MALDKETALAVARKTASDPVYFCSFFLSHWFPKPMPWVHRGILAVLTRKTNFLLKYGELDKIERHFVWKDDPDDMHSEVHKLFHVEWDEEGNPLNVSLEVSKYTLIMMPRGFAKTTLVNAANLYFILFQLCDFPVYVSETATHAETQLANVRREIEGNELIQAVFGNLRPDQRQGLKWTGDMLETRTGIVIAARGRGAQVRGMNVRGNRPDKIIMDDVEDKESVRTEEQRAKTREWFYQDLLPALPAMNPDAGVVALGTLLHSEALLEVLKRDPEWTVITFGALDLDSNPLWPDNMNQEDIDRKKKSYARAGQLAGFYMEFFNLLRADELSRFRADMIQTWAALGITGVAQEKMHKGIALDPAISERRDADNTAIMVAGMEEGGRIHVLDCWGKVGAIPREMVDEYFRLGKLWDCHRYGIEAIAFQAALIHLMREEMFRKHWYFEIEAIKHSTQQKKTERVEGILQPRYANGYIVHRVHFPQLEVQLLDWPNGKKDFPDALAMAVSLLDPYAAQAADPNKDLGDDEYEPLDKVLNFKRAP